MDESELKRLEDLQGHAGPSVKNYPLDSWWAIATVSEVGEKPLARNLLQKRVVLFRASDGKPHALMDRCPHRWAPLSMGKVIQDEIVCAYHGFRYNVKGECTLAPSMQQPPRALRACAYPAIDYGPFVWVWMGCPENADPTLLPTIVRKRNADQVIAGYQLTSCDFSLIHENIADTEHTLYLHGKTVGNDVRIDFRRKGKVHGVMDADSRAITFLSSARDIPPSKFDIALLGLEKTESCNISTNAVFTAPGCFSAEIEWAPSERRPGSAGQSVKGLYMWCSTPISDNSCHFWWDLAFDGAVFNPEVVKDLWSKLIKEDIDIVEGVQRSIDSSRDAKVTDLLVVADRPVAAIRRLLRAMGEA
ncbi:MAG: Rieske 2Fe-2S domain-containing protein [Steroidobacteraceae bacterium]